MRGFGHTMFEGFTRTAIDTFGARIARLLLGSGAAVLLPHSWERGRLDRLFDVSACELVAFFA